MTIFFIILAVLGVVLLVVGLIGGIDIGDAGGDGVISLPALGALLAAGGATGGLLAHDGREVSMTLGVAAVVGLGAALPVVLVTRRLRRMADSATARSLGDYLGATGEVVHAAGARNPGLVDFVLDGESVRKRVVAAEGEAVSVGMRVVVVDTGSEAADELVVAPLPGWLEPANGEDAAPPAH